MKNKPIYLLLILYVVIVQACKTDALEKQDDTPKTEILSVINCLVENSYEDWVAGFYLDTSMESSRNYLDILTMYPIDSLKFGHVINNLYPRSCFEFSCFYDSLTKSIENRQLYFRRIDTLFVRYAAFDSSGCFQLLLNMTKFIDPRKTDIDWISGLELDIYYNVIDEDNLYNFQNFYDTCDRCRYYFLPEWVKRYNSSLRH